MMKNKKLSIYIHIPFCEKKCNYCAFVSYCVETDEQNRYVDYLVKEISNFNTPLKVKTIYVGGGTPSILSISNLKRIFAAIFEKFKVENNAEITIEVNPNSICEEKLKAYREIGINRLSIAVQSLNDAVLKKIGRLHTSKEAIEKVQLARKFFDNISVDLILGLENDIDSFKFADELLRFGVKHISAYLLEVHKNTPLFESVKSGKYQPQPDENVADEYEKLVDFLDKKGLRQYEISNFALKGCESQHNLNYWNLGEYVGFGISAHSYLNGKRSANPDNFKEYYKGKKIFDENNTATEIEERIFLGLRCESGVDIKKLKSLGYNIEEKVENFLESGILYCENNKLKLNKKFYLVSDFIISHLL